MNRTDQEVMDEYANALRKITILRDALRECGADLSNINDDICWGLYGNVGKKVNAAEDRIEEALEKTK